MINVTEKFSSKLCANDFKKHRNSTAFANEVSDEVFTATKPLHAGGHAQTRKMKLANVDALGEVCIFKI